LLLTIVTAAALVSLCAWIYLLAFRGGFWRVRDESEPPGTAPPRRVAVVIPARDEAASIGRTVQSLAKQDFEGEIRILVVDDHSTDGTAEMARAALNGVEVIQAAPLPPGWTGKMWAVSQGLSAAFAGRPDYVLLTDADIEHAPFSLRSLIARAERDRFDLVSFMVRLENRSLAERASIPAFVFFFLMLYPPRWIADPGRCIAGAAGGCMLVRTGALERIDGVSRIKSEVIDDCALAREIKRAGGRVWLGLSMATRSLRRYAGFGEVAHMIARTAFTQLRYSSLLLVATVVGMSVIYLAPVVALCSGAWRTAIAGGAAWAMMAAAYIPMLRLYRQSPAWAIGMPAIAAFYTYATILSAIRYWVGRGGMWKGRVQAVR
jgi:hopene-associated glycosyltransferase HpnB